MSLHKFIFDVLLQGMLLVVSLVGVYRFKYLSKDLQIIVYFVLIGTFTEFFMDFYRANIAQNTMPIAHFYFPITAIILCFFYRKVLAGFVKTWIIDLLMIVNIVYAIINMLFIQSLQEFPSLVGAFGALIVIIFSVLLFARIMTEAKIHKLGKEPLVWINIGILLFYAGSLFYFITFNLNVENAYEFLRQTVGYIYAFLNVLLYAFTAIGLLLSKKIDKYRTE